VIDGEGEESGRIEIRKRKCGPESVRRASVRASEACEMRLTRLVLARVVCAETSVFGNLARTRRACQLLSECQIKNTTLYEWLTRAMYVLVLSLLTVFFFKLGG